MSRNVANDCFRVLTDERCTLRAPLRHLAMVLAQLANWKTGRGIAGQGRIARATGLDSRTVRRLKAELASASPNPLTVTWRHRSRPDGLNGSDAYMIGLSALGLEWLDTGHLVRDTGQSDRDTGHLALPISPVVPPRETPQESRENSKIGESGSLTLPQVINVEGFAPNESHAAVCLREGYDVAAEVVAWAATHERRGSTWRSFPERDGSFGGWLRNVAPKRRAGAARRPKALTPAELEAAEVAAWRASLEAGGT